MGREGASDVCEPPHPAGPSLSEPPLPLATRRLAGVE